MLYQFRMELTKLKKSKVFPFQKSKGENSFFQELAVIFDDIPCHGANIQRAMQSAPQEDQPIRWMVSI